MKKSGIIISAISVVAALLISSACKLNAEPVKEQTKINLVSEWDKTFPKSEKVNHSKVTFRNRFGITACSRYVYS